MDRAQKSSERSSLVSSVQSKAIKITESKGPNVESLTQKLQEQTKSARRNAKDDRAVQAYFIGPRGENIGFFSQLIQKAINSHLAARVEYQLQDSRHISRQMKQDPSFLDAQDRLQRALDMVLTQMKDLTPPFFSSRYFGHMIWETTIPSIVGNFATMLYNPNNCAFEASPFTTLLEIEVMKEFAIMFDYPKFLTFNNTQGPKQNYSWGHLTCGGTVANCQAFWAARNCRFLALSIRKYIEQVHSTNTCGVKDIQVILCNKSSKKLLDLTAWEIINITNQDTMELYDLAYKTLHPGAADNATNYNEYQNGVAKYSIGKRGLIDMYDWLNDINAIHPQPEWKNNHGRIPKHKAFVSATAHYSIRKSASILGLGEEMVEKVVVDLDSRISIKALTQKLQDCLTKKVPVLVVAGIVGTTEQSTVDNLEQIYNLRAKYSDKGLYFHFHIDGAYGGYFVCLTQQKDDIDYNSYSPFVLKQLETFRHSDSITFDPHKTGYVPYTCGGIIYRNHRLRDNLSFSAPYIYTGAQPNMAIYGVQGSKPGSAVTSVYLSIQVMPLVRGGHGQLLQRTLVNTKIFTASLYRVSQIDVEYTYDRGDRKGVLNQRFECLLLPRLYCEKKNKPQLRNKELEHIRKISQVSPTDLTPVAKLKPTEQFEDQIYYQLGPDLNIVCYGLNFRDPVTKEFNKSLKKFNQYNRTLIKLSKPVGSDVSARMKDLYVSETQINKHTYGEQIFNDFLSRHNLIADGDEQIVFIRSTIMNAFFTEPKVDEKTKVVESPNKTFLIELVENGCQTLLHLGWR